MDHVRTTSSRPLCHLHSSPSPSPHCRDNDITGIIHNSFAVEHDHFGKLATHELKPGGYSQPVTEESKAEYVGLYVQWRLQRGTVAQFSALLKGFHELIPPDVLGEFNEKELEVREGLRGEREGGGREGGGREGGGREGGREGGGREGG